MSPGGRLVIPFDYLVGDLIELMHWFYQAGKSVYNSLKYHMPDIVIQV